MTRFGWDDAKDLSNQTKHGLSFAGAKKLFESGANYLEIFDAVHSKLEDRFIAIGPIDRGIAVVVYSVREDDLVRIIGARLANRREQALYLSHLESHR